MFRRRSRSGPPARRFRHSLHPHSTRRQDEPRSRSHSSLRLATPAADRSAANFRGRDEARPPSTSPFPSLRAVAADRYRQLGAAGSAPPLLLLLFPTEPAPLPDPSRPADRTAPRHSPQGPPWRGSLRTAGSPATAESGAPRSS